VYDRKLNSKELVAEGKKWWPQLLTWIKSYKGSESSEDLLFMLLKSDYKKKVTYDEKEAKLFYSYIVERLKNLGITARISNGTDWTMDNCWNLYAPTSELKRIRNKVGD